MANSGDDSNKPRGASSSLQARFMAEADASAARLAAESAARAAAARAEQERVERHEHFCASLAIQLNAALRKTNPPLSCEFYAGKNLAQTGPVLHFGQGPETKPVDDTTRLSDMARIEEALAMLNIARLSGTLTIQKSTDGKTLSLAAIGGRDANFPALQASDLQACLEKKDTGKYLDICVSIETANRAAPMAKHAFNGIELWNEFRAGEHEKLVSNANLGGSDFRGFNLSGLRFAPNTIVANAHFSGADISGADFSQSRRMQPWQFDNALTSDATKLPDFTVAPSAPIKPVSAGRTSLNPPGESSGATEEDFNSWAERFNRSDTGPNLNER